MRMLHGNLKVKFPVAGGEAIYAAIFFNNRNHADDTNSVIALMGNGDLILEDRFHGVGVDHINTEAVAFFVCRHCPGVPSAHRREWHFRMHFQADCINP